MRLQIDKDDSGQRCYRSFMFDTAMLNMHYIFWEGLGAEVGNREEGHSDEVTSNSFTFIVDKYSI